MMLAILWSFEDCYRSYSPHFNLVKMQHYFFHLFSYLEFPIIKIKLAYWPNNIYKIINLLLIVCLYLYINSPIYINQTICLTNFSISYFITHFFRYLKKNYKVKCFILLLLLFMLTIDLNLMVVYLTFFMYPIQLSQIVQLIWLMQISSIYFGYLYLMCCFFI